MNLFNIKSAQAEPCKGIIVRYIKRAFIVRNGLRHVEEIRVLKRRSCAGCANCNRGILEMLTEFPDAIAFDPALQDGDVAQLQIVEVSTDWETGCVDDWYVFARRVDK